MRRASVRNGYRLLIFNQSRFLDVHEAANYAESVKCSECKKNVPPTEAFACKTCSADEQTVVLVCGACAMRHHRAHDVVEYAAMANAADIVSAMRDHLQHNITVQRHSTELHFAIGVVEGSVQRLVQVNQQSGFWTRHLTLDL